MVYGYTSIFFVVVVFMPFLQCDLLGPVVQSIVSLTESLVKDLSSPTKSIADITFAEKL